MRWAKLLLLVPLTSGCASSKLVQIPSADSRTIVAAFDPSAFEIVTRSSEVRDPLPVVTRSRARVAYAELDVALGQELREATLPWALEARAKQPSGWKLLAELTQAEARYEGGRFEVLLSVRVTLRSRVGDVYRGQTQLSCQEARVVAPDAAAPVIQVCLRRIAGDLAGWLGGLAP